MNALTTTVPEPASQRVPGRCTTCGARMGEGAVLFIAGGGCCAPCLHAYRADCPPKMGGRQARKTGAKTRKAKPRRAVPRVGCSDDPDDFLLMGFPAGWIPEAVGLLAEA